jgi:hypothetical protein
MPSKSFTGSSEGSIDVSDVVPPERRPVSHLCRRKRPTNLLMLRARPSRRRRDQDVLVQVLLYGVNEFGAFDELDPAVIPGLDFASACEPRRCDEDPSSGTLLVHCAN